MPFAAQRRRCSRSPHEQCYWWADLTADTTLESDYVLLELWLHPPQEGVWNPPSRRRIEKAVRSIVGRQLPDGGFNIYPDGPADLSATVKAYFAMKLAGMHPDEPASNALARGSWTWAAFSPRTATSKSTSVCSICIHGSIARRFRRRSCCCRGISSIRCLPGPGPS